MTPHELEELVRENIISRETATQIASYYKSKQEQPKQNRLLLVFGILGALLIGLGIILILASNWDELPKTVRVLFAFLPLVAMQILCGYTLLRKNDNRVWRESSALLLIFAIGASISLISQIYHISGEMSTFLLTWILLGLPIIYIMKSATSSILYLIGITVYAMEIGYWNYPTRIPYEYWLLLVGIIPFYHYIRKEQTLSNFVFFHHIIIALSVTIMLSSLSKGESLLMFIPYMNLFGIFLLMGSTPLKEKLKIHDNALFSIGTIGTLILLYINSFHSMWRYINNIEDIYFQFFDFPLFIPMLLTTIIGFYLFISKLKKVGWGGIRPLEFIFIFFFILIITFMKFPTIIAIGSNLAILLIGIKTILRGIKQNHLGVVNFGLIIISTLILTRFFDTNISFLLRGLIFIGIGIGFFVTNYQLLKKRKAHE